MSILHRLGDAQYWEEFLCYKRAGGHLTRSLEKQLVSFIAARGYEPTARDILEKKPFPLPSVVELNKKNSTKKRTVFVFDERENFVLKLIAYALHRFDSLFSDNVYSFRKDICVKTAITDVLRKTRGRSLYSYKVDIHDYFNSVDTAKISSMLDDALCDDVPLKEFLQALLKEPDCIKGGERITRKKGIMAGVPVSGFLANLYLSEMDAWFAERGIPYARYSDDVIVFAPSEEKILTYEKVIKDFLCEKGLEVNPQKEARCVPNEPWEFLGFRINGDQVDVGTVALEKIKAKMKRKARALLRWKKRKQASTDRAMRAFIRAFNKKFFENATPNDITWCRWYFPTLTTAESLREIDRYMVSCIRYIATGKHTKANYGLRYESIKDMGYRSLVHAFYAFKKTGVL